MSKVRKNVQDWLVWFNGVSAGFGVLAVGLNSDTLGSVVPQAWIPVVVLVVGAVNTGILVVRNNLVVDNTPVPKKKKGSVNA